MFNSTTNSRNINHDQAIEQYKGFGFDTVPLLPGSKKSAVKEYQYRSPEDMWRGQPKNANIGIRAGGPGNLAVIDCDDKKEPGTLAKIQNWLSGLGYREGTYPLVRSASGIGGHIYINWLESWPKNVRQLNHKFGSGDFRYGPGAYVVAPPSVVGPRKYELISGEFLHRPTLTEKDLQEILLSSETQTSVLSPDLSLKKRIPRSTMRLLQGYGFERYPTRSEAEQSILTGLVNAGNSFDDALKLFNKHPGAGKFRDLFQISPKDAEKWLFKCYKAAQEWAPAHESEPRKIAKGAIIWAKNRPWPGRTGQTDKVLFITHANIAYKAGKIQYSASARQLAIDSGISPESCMKATRRLQTSGLIFLATESVGDCANIYRLESQSLTYPPPPCEEVSDFGTENN